METKINWYIEQKVWDKTISKNSGKIESFNNPVEKYPIIVNFSGFKQSYTIDGKLALDILVPTLSTKPYEIKMEGFSQEVEEELPKEGQIVWAKIDDDENWAIAHFLRKQSTHYLVSDTNSEKEKYPCNQITTKNPYEDVSEMENTDREPQIGDMCFFWDDEKPVFVICGELLNIGKHVSLPYTLSTGSVYRYCSLKNPLIK